MESARRRWLAEVGTPIVGKRGPGRPKKIASEPSNKKRVLSAEARAKIAAAQKKRWAAAKKAK